MLQSARQGWRMDRCKEQIGADVPNESYLLQRYADDRMALEGRGRSILRTRGRRRRWTTAKTKF